MNGKIGIKKKERDCYKRVFCLMDRERQQDAGMKGGLYIFLGPTSDWRSHQQNTPQKPQLHESHGVPNRSCSWDLLPWNGRTSARLLTGPPCLDFTWIGRWTGTPPITRRCSCLLALTRLQWAMGWIWQTDEEEKKKKKRFVNKTPIHGSLLEPFLTLFLFLFSPFFFFPWLFWFHLSP